MTVAKEIGYETAATLTIKRADEMTAKGRERVAEWLRKQADQLEQDGPEYSKRFIARYWWKAKGGKKK